MKKKKLLTLDDLYEFVSKQDFARFDANETGYQLCVQAPALFEKEDTEDPFTLFANCLVMHTALNRNHSYVTESAIKGAMKNLAYKPVLANFCEIDGVRDFTSHDFTVDEDGNYVYYEHQIGCFTADEPELRDTDDEERKDLWAKIAIPREYTDAADIIERKGGTKVSVELCINAFEYDVKNKQIMYTDIDITGLTCLGVDPDTGEEVQEGMKGASIKLEDFSAGNNSMVQHIISSVTQTVLGQLSNNNSKAYEGKEENEMEKEGFANEEETFEEESAEVNAEEEVEEIKVEEEAETAEEEQEEFSSNLKQFSINGVTFEISLSEIFEAIYTLVNDTYGEIDNEWYGCEIYQESKNVVMIGYFTGKCYKQAYKVKNGVYSLVGDRVPVKAVYVTEDEEAELDRMRGNYSAISEELAKYKAEPEKMKILNSEEYLNIADTKDFESLMDINNHFDMSVDELKSACDNLLLNFAKKTNFTKNESEKKTTTFKMFTKAPIKNKKRYGDLFD